jgi:hypothetical protein
MVYSSDRHDYAIHQRNPLPIAHNARAGCSRSIAYREGNTSVDELPWVPARKQKLPALNLTVPSAQSVFLQFPDLRKGS